MNRQVRRIQKAIDELLKIKDDGKGCETIEHILDQLRDIQSAYED